MNCLQNSLKLLCASQIVRACLLQVLWDFDHFLSTVAGRKKWFSLQKRDHYGKLMPTIFSIEEQKWTTKSLTLEKHQRVVKESLESSKSSESYHRVPRVIEKSPELEPSKWKVPRARAIKMSPESSKCHQSHQTFISHQRHERVIRNIKECIQGKEGKL